MKKINILDCTLRDGGYINNWEFGYNAIVDICEKLGNTGADIVEIGFVRDIEFSRNNATLSGLEDLQNFVPQKKRGVKYAAMIGMDSYYPPGKIVNKSDKTFDIIRYVFWKRCMDEGIEYAKKIKDKGYELAIQPTRVEQYSKVEFSEMVKRFGEIEPYALYIVDTFGLLTKDVLLEYVEIADKYLDKKIALGYHAHNNMQQAFANAMAFADISLQREKYVDVSAYGMGKGAGNLSSEIYLNWLNEKYDTDYNLLPIYEIWDKWLKDVYDRNRWGYTPYYYLSSLYKANPNFADFFEKNGFSVIEANKILSHLPYEERIIFTKEKAARILEMKE